jgi:hypothetical protein
MLMPHGNHRAEENWAAALLTVDSVKTFYEKKGLYLYLFLYNNLKYVRNLVSYL